MVFQNRDLLDQFDCEIASYARKKAEISNCIEKTEHKKIEYGFLYYNKKEKRENIISLAEQYGFSDKKLCFMNKYVDNWNHPSFSAFYTRNSKRLGMTGVITILKKI